MAWVMWLRVVAVTVILLPFVQAATRLWAQGTQKEARHLRVLESCSLGNDGRVYLVAVGDKVWALAAGGKGLEVLGQVDAPQMLSAQPGGEGVRARTSLLPQSLATVAEQARALFRHWRESASTRSAEVVWDEDGNRTVAALQLQLERLRRLGAGDGVFAAGRR